MIDKTLINWAIVGIVIASISIFYWNAVIKHTSLNTNINNDKGESIDSDNNSKNRETKEINNDNIRIVINPFSISLNCTSNGINEIANGSLIAADMYMPFISFWITNGVIYLKTQPYEQRIINGETWYSHEGDG